MPARAAQPAPSDDTTYKEVYQTFWTAEGITLPICKIVHHVAYQHWGLNSTTTSSISQELAGTLQTARYPLFQRLRRCTNAILTSVWNSYNECLLANISVTAPPAWAITRAVTIVFWFNILHENSVQVPLKHVMKIAETVVRHCDSKPK
jgi:hypothetical protein